MAKRHYMRTELICVGTELLTGKLNTNVSYIGERLGVLGFDLHVATAVGDDRTEMGLVFRQALERSDVIIVTGGLGPTFDDLTRDVLADTLGKPLILDQKALTDITNYFKSRNYPMPKHNERQAYLIEGAVLLPNGMGTAPGQRIDLEREGNHRTTIFLLPGPPREMQHLFEAAVFPYLERFRVRIKKSATIHICGVGESAVDEKIRPILEAERKLESDCVQFVILAHQSMIVDIRVSVWGEDEMLVDETLHNIRLELHDALGKSIYGEDKQTLEGAVGALLAHGRKTFAVAESCTGGLVSQKITSVAGSSVYFLQGVVSYSNDAKEKALGVSAVFLEKYGAVSEQVAREMAEGMRKLSGADYSVSLTGIAGPGGGTKEKPVGLVFIGVSGDRGTEVFDYKFGGTRSDIRERAANQALELLRRRLIQESGPAADEKKRSASKAGNRSRMKKR